MYLRDSSVILKQHSFHVAQMPYFGGAIFHEDNINYYIALSATYSPLHRTRGFDFTSRLLFEIGGI